MKCFIARIMLLVMLFTAIIPSLNVAIVYADVVTATPFNVVPSQTITASFDTINLTLNSGPQNHITPLPPIPGVSGPLIARPNDIRLNLGIGGLDPTAGNAIQFYYLNAQSQRVVFEVSFNDNPDLHQTGGDTFGFRPLTARYRVEEFNAATNQWVPRPLSNVVVSAGGSWLTPYQFTNNLLEVDREFHYVVWDEVGHQIEFEFRTSDPTTTPSATNQGGFSFQVNAGHETLTIHFRHNAISNVIEFETSGMQKDIIYNFHRQVLAPVSGILQPVPDELTYTRAFVGMDTNSPTNFSFIPFSVGRVEDHIGDTSGMNISNDPAPFYQLDADEGDLTVYGGAGLAIRFHEPNEAWIDYYGLPRIEPLSSRAEEDGIEYVMPISISMIDNFGGTIGTPQRITINVANIFDLQVVGDLLEGPSETPGFAIESVPNLIHRRPTVDNSWAGIISDDDADRKVIEIRLTEFEPGMIFGGVSVTSQFSGAEFNGAVIIDDEQVPTRVHNLTGGELNGTVNFQGIVNTFPEYRFIFVDGNFHVEILTPFRHMPGVYRVRTSETELFSRIVTVEDLISTNHAPINLLIAPPVGDRSLYQILFEPDGSAFTAFSETSWFTASPDLIYMNAPRDFLITDYNFSPIPTHYPWGTAGLLSMDLEWYLGNPDHITAMIGHTTAQGEPDPDNPDEIIDFIEVSYYINKALRPEANLGAPFARLDMRIRYDDNTHHFHVEYDINRIISDDEREPLSTSTEGIATFHRVAPMTLQLLDIPVSRLEPPATEGENQNPLFFFPRIYHINMDTRIDNEETGEVNLFSSSFQTITLDDLVRPMLPPVQDLTIDYVTESSVSLSMGISGVEVLNFMEASAHIDSWVSLPELSDALSILDDDLEFNINLYISQSEALMLELADLQDRQERRDFGSLVYFPSASLIYEDTDYDILLNNNVMQQLRSNNIALIENIIIDADQLRSFIMAGANAPNMPLSLNIHGLDENQMYYIYITFGSRYAPQDFPNINDEQESIFSQLLGFTTVGIPNIPGEADMVPLPPEIQITDVGLDTATIFWPHVEMHPPIDLPENNISVHYEIIRIRGEQMDPRLITAPGSIRQFIDMINAQMPGVEIAALRTPPYTDQLQVFDGTNFVDADPAHFTFTSTLMQLYLVDNTLVSNQLYFYYVRTVRVVYDENGIPTYSYSVWAAETATTTALSAPVNLQIYLDADVDYDPKTEFMIRFDAEILNLDLLTQAAGPEVVFELSIRVEDEEFSDPILMSSTLLLNNYSESIIPGHTAFSYRISGLIPSTGYTIRVRMVNLRTNDVSPWSNTATTRTDMDQNLADEERDLDAWTHYYDQELQELIRNTYWTLQDTTAEFRIVYRPSMFDTIIATTSGSQILLAQGNASAHTHVYYIPSSILLQANEQNLSFSIHKGDVEVIIPSNVLDTEYNSHIVHTNNQIANSNVDVVDYFLRVTVRRVPHLANVHGNTPLSPQVQVSFDVVAANQTGSSWDDEILEMHMREIYRQMQLQSIQNWIINSLRTERPPAEIVSHILQLVNNVRTVMIRDTNASFNRIRRFTRSVNELDTSMIIIYKNTQQATVFNGYRWTNNNWQLLEPFNFGEFIGIRPNVPGIFIFAGRIVNVDGLTGMPNAGIAFAIIVKYNLQDILGSNYSIDLDRAVTRNMFMESVARIGGATAGYDPAQFLRQRGHFIPSGNMQANITTQEALYLSIAIYEIRTGTRAETIVIRNHGLTSNIQGIDQRFLTSIRAAFEIGLHTDTTMQPNASITVNQMLQMLTLLDSKVDL